MNFISAHKSFVIKSKETNCQGQVKKTLWLESPRCPGSCPSYIQAGFYLVHSHETAIKYRAVEAVVWASSLPPTVVARSSEPCALGSDIRPPHRIGPGEQLWRSLTIELGHPRPRACVSVFSQTLYWLFIYSLGCSYLYQVTCSKLFQLNPVRILNMALGLCPTHPTLSVRDQPEK